MAALPFLFVGIGSLARDESVRMFGLVICVGGLLAVAAFIVSPQFLRIDLLESPSIQGSIPLIGFNFMLSAMVFGADWKKFASFRFASNMAGKIG